MVYQDEKITVVGVVVENKTRIGVAVRGKHEPNNPQRGISIATSRSEMMPYSVIPQPVTQAGLDLIALAIKGNVLRTKQWNQKTLRRDRT